MPFLEPPLFVIQMVCTSVQRTKSILESESQERIEFGESCVSEKMDHYDVDARKMRRHLAQERALRQLEMRKAHALAEVHRSSLIR